MSTLLTSSGAPSTWSHPPLTPVAAALRDAFRTSACQCAAFALPVERVMEPGSRFAAVIPFTAGPAVGLE